LCWITYCSAVNISANVEACGTGLSANVTAYAPAGFGNSFMLSILQKRFNSECFYPLFRRFMLDFHSLEIEHIGDLFIIITSVINVF